MIACSILYSLLLLLCVTVVCWSHPLFVLTTADSQRASGDENFTFASEKYPSLSKWTSHAYEYLHKFSCHDILFMTRGNCQRLQARTSEKMALYVAVPVDTKYRVLRTDGPDFKYAVHDAVLVIDPFPEKKSNHLLMVFFIDLNVDRIHCEFRNGQYLGNGECLTLGLNRGCSNVWNQVSSPRKRIRYARRCENKHLPIAQMVSSSEAASPSSPTPVLKSGESLLSAERAIAGDKRINHLKCSDDVTGFIACSMVQEPEFATKLAPTTHSTDAYSENRASSSSSSSSSSDDCDPLQTNDSPWKCIRTRSATEEDE